jgi:hypothetical protein
MDSSQRLSVTSVGRMPELETQQLQGSAAASAINMKQPSSAERRTVGIVYDQAMEWHVREGKSAAVMPQTTQQQQLLAVLSASWHNQHAHAWPSMPCHIKSVILYHFIRAADSKVGPASQLWSRSASTLACTGTCPTSLSAHLQQQGALHACRDLQTIQQHDTAHTVLHGPAQCRFAMTCQHM